MSPAADRRGRPDRDGSRDPDAGSPRSALAASLAGSPWADRVDGIDALLAAEAIDATRLEASVRGGGAAPPSGGRLMIERVSPAFARAFFRCLGVALDAADAALLDWAERRSLPAITGWDVGRRPPVAKLYVNASDASQTLRRELGACLGEAALAPHVAGVNRSASGERELKGYEQLAAPPAGAPAALTAWAAGAPVAGWVRSLDLVPGGATTRALFAALHPTEGAPELRSLPGWSEAAVAALPFPIGYAKSVGFDPEGERWVAYVKPAGARPTGHALEPVACFAGAGVELGLHLEPLEAAAYVRTARASLSYRVREGEPERAAVARLMRWAADRVREAEREQRAPRWADPPSPWRLLDG